MNAEEMRAGEIMEKPGRAEQPERAAAAALPPSRQIVEQTARRIPGKRSVAIEARYADGSWAMARKGPLEEMDDASFDIAFWGRVPPEGRLRAAWDMIRDYAALTGAPDPDEQRLDRTVGGLRTA